jgi:sporulation protein YlmC with PRC-barrel domain
VSLASDDQLEETVQTDIDPRSLIGRKAFDRNGTKIGTVDEVYLDDATGAPEWAAVRTGLFSRDAFVPLAPSEIVDEALRVPFDRSVIRQAPDFGVGRHLSPEQELQLYHHYGLDVPRGGPDDESPSGGDFGRLASPPEG